MRPIFKYKDYKSWAVDWVELRPQKGRGLYLKMANFLRTSSTIISQIFKGERHLSIEQASELVEFFDLTEIEGRYFCMLVMQERSGSKKSSDFFRKEMERIKESSLDLKERLPGHKTLSNSDKAIYYSHWLYTAIRNLAATNLNSVDEIALHLNLSRSRVDDIVKFLLRNGLCQINQQGKLTYGHLRTHIEKESLLASSHHKNWRQKAIENYHKMDHQEELSLTFPMTISQKDTAKIKSMLVNFISQVNEVVDQSECEQCVCLNIDWFRF